MTLAEPFRVFLCNFFTEALASVLLSWVQQPTAVTRDKDGMLNYMEHVSQTALPAVIRGAKDRGAGYVVVQAAPDAKLNHPLNGWFDRIRNSTAFAADFPQGYCIA